MGSTINATRRLRPHARSFLDSIREFLTPSIWRQADQARRQELADLDASLEAFDELMDLVTRAALVAAGYQQHRRGEWRKKRGQPEKHP